MGASFRGTQAYRSNMFSVGLTVNGLHYENAEACFQSFKCKNKSDRLKFCLLNGSEAKRLGRGVRLRNDWHDIKDEVMYLVVRAKFRQNPFLREELCSSTDEIVEVNTWNDTYWGVCNGQGLNKLGKILERVREELRNERY